MKITNLIGENYFGIKINLRYYEAINPTKNLVLFCHGKGEVGPADGSMINKVEKWGWPGFAKGIRPGESTVRGTVEYPFNIAAIQVELSYGNYLKSIPAWLMYRFGAENIIIAGISLGCIAAYDMLAWDKHNKVLGVVACCGNESVSAVPAHPKYKGIAWHGMNDTTVSHSSHLNFVNAYNTAKGPEGHIEFNSLPGVGHNAWDYAFKADESQDKSLAFVNGLFAEHSQPVDQKLSEVKTKLQQIVDFI